MKTHYLRAIFLALILSLGPLWANVWLGFSFVTTPLDSGRIALTIKGVHPESGARLAGLQPGDQVVALENQPIHSLERLKRRLGISHPGQTLRITVMRGKQKLLVPVKLTPRPDNISQLTGSVLGNRAQQLSKHFYANQERLKQSPKATLLDFWATWCGPCRQTLPILDALYKKLGPEGLEIIGISTESQNVLDAFQQQKKSPYPLYRDADQSQSRRYGIQAIPTLLLLDHQGYIQRVYQGAPPKIQLEQDIRTIMNGAPRSQSQGK